MLSFIYLSNYKVKCFSLEGGGAHGLPEINWLEEMGSHYFDIKWLIPKRLGPSGVEMGARAIDAQGHHVRADFEDYHCTLHDAKPIWLALKWLICYTANLVFVWPVFRWRWIGFDAKLSTPNFADIFPLCSLPKLIPRLLNYAKHHFARYNFHNKVTIVCSSSYIPCVYCLGATVLLLKAFN